MALHVFGLTGGIGSGKSSVARLLRERAVPVIDADELAREAVAPGSSGLEQVIAAFGAEVLEPGRGRLDRKRLGALVFAEPEARMRLNAIVHPRVRELAQARFSELDGAGVELAGYDVPLLFEAGLEQALRPVVLVWVSAETQLTRLTARDGSNEPEARSRIAAQLPLDEKRARADYVLDNEGSLELLPSKVEELVRWLQSTLLTSP